MSIYTRLFFALFAAAALGIFGWGFVSPDMLSPRSEGQILMHWSLVPAALTLLTATFYTRSHKDTFLYLLLTCGGAFLAMVCAGMYKLNGEYPYAIIAWLSISVSCASIGIATLHVVAPDITPSRT
jgi:hypothetical protein